MRPALFRRFRWPILLVAMVWPAIARAQSIIGVRGGAGGRIQVVPGAKVAIPVIIDMASASGTTIASLASSIAWNNSRLIFDSVRTGGFGSLSANTSNVASGALTFSVADAVGTTSTVTTAMLYFTAAATVGSTSVAFQPTAATTPGNANILSQMRSGDLDVCVAGGLWGDVNLDATPNIIDAQQIARASVGLSVLNAAAVTAGGDVTGDNAVNILDAQQIARFSVGLSASPRVSTVLAPVPAASSLVVTTVLEAVAGFVNQGVALVQANLVAGNQGQIKSLVTDAGGTDITSCVPIAYGSSNPAVATISTTGLVTITGSGTTIVGVSSGSANAGGPLSVGGTAAAVAFVTPPASTTAGTLITPAVQVRIVDALGATMTTATNTVTIAIGTNPASGTLGGTLTVAAVNGIATFSDLTIDNAGTGYTLAASTSGLTGATSTTFDVTIPPPATLQFQVQPSNTTVTRAIAPPLEVKILNSLGALATTATNSVTIAIGANPGGGTLSGTLTVAAVNGIATFSNLAIDNAGTGYTLVASATGLTSATSTAFNELAPTLVFQVQPSSVAATVVMAPAPTVRVLDQANAVMTGFTGNVTLAIGTNPGSATLGGTLTQPLVNGVATFNDLTLNAPASGYTLTASAATVTGATSNTFNVTAAPPVALQFLAQPSNATITRAIAPAVTVQIMNALGGVVTTATHNVTIAIGANPATGTLGGTLTVAAVNGIATFSGLSIDKVGAGYTLTAAATGLTGATSTTFNALAPTLAFQAQPTDVPATVVMSPATTVRVLDQANAVMTGFTGSVTVAIGANPGSATLGGTLTQPLVNGVATFNDLTLNAPASGYTLTASAATVAGTTSNTFNVTAAPPVALQFLAQPSNTTITRAIAPAVTVRIMNALGGVVTTATDNVTIAIGTNPATGTVSGTLTVAAVNGVATFSNLSIDKAGTGYTLTAAATGLTGATSATFNELAPTLAFQTQPSNVAATVAMTPAPTVRLLDQANAVMTGFTGSVTVAIGANPGSATLNGTLTQPLVNGVATFTGLSLTAPGSGYTLTASGTSMVGTTSTTFDVSAAPATALQFQVQPANATATITIAPPVQVKIVNSLGGTVVTASNSVTIAIGANPASGTLSGTLTVAAVNGVATFSNLSIDNIGSGYTLTAAATGLTGMTSTSFDVLSPVNAVSWVNPAGGNWSVGSNWSTGTVPTSSDSVLIKQSGTYTVTVDQTALIGHLDVGGPTGTQTIDLPASTLLITNTGRLRNNTRVRLLGGTLSGAANVQTSGTFDWQAGTLTGFGTLTVLTGGQLSISTLSAKSLDNGYTLEIGVAGVWTGTGTINTGHASTLRVLPGGVLDVQNAASLLSDLGGPPSHLNNQALVRRSTNPGAFTVSALVDNDGTMSSQVGSIRMTGGGTSTGRFEAASGALLDFGGGSHVLTAASLVTDPGTARVSGGTMSAAGGWNISATQITGGAASFDGPSMTTASLIVNGGTLGGSGGGLLGVTGAMSWTGGSLLGAGGTTRVLSGGTLDISGDGTARSLDGYTLELGGTGTWNTTIAGITGDNGAVLRVLAGGLLNVTGDQGMGFIGGGTAPRIVTYGTLRRSVSANAVGFGVAVDDSGTVDVQTGTLALNDRGTANGVFTVSSGATLQFGGLHDLSAASSVTGAGTVIAVTGSLTAAGVWNVTGTTEVNGSTVLLNGASKSTGGLSVFGGSLGGSALLQVSGAASWLGGNLSGGGGRTRVLSGGTLTVGGAGTGRTLDGYSLESAGIGTWNVTSAEISGGNGGTVRVLAGGQLDVQSDFGIQHNIGGAVPRVVVYGTLRRTVSPNAVLFTAVLDDSGTVAVQTGTLQLGSGGLSSGVFTVASGAALQFSGGSHTMAATASVGGAGTVLMTGGTVTQAGGWSVTGVTTINGGTFDFDGTGSTATYAVLAGQQGGAGTLTVTGPMTWSGGNLAGTGGGTTRAQGTLAMSSNGNVSGHHLDIAGTATWTGSSTIHSGNGGKISVLGGASVTITGTPAFMYDLGGTTSEFVNLGTLTKNTNTGTAQISALFTNSGTINLNTGNLLLTLGGTLGGSVAANTTGEFRLGGGTFTAVNGFAVTGPSATVLLAGTLAGLPAVNDTAQISNLVLTGGTLGPTAGAVRVTTSAQWSGTTSLSGGGSLHIPPTASLTISGGSARTISNFTIDNFSTSSIWSGTASVAGSNGAVIRNRGSGVISLNATSAAYVDLGIGAASRLDNQGSLIAGLGAANAFLATARFDNSGTISLNSGQLQLAGGGTQSGAVALASGTSFDFSGGLHTLNNGFTATGAGFARTEGGTVTTATALDTARFVNLQLDAGSLLQPGGVVVSGSLSWAGSTAIDGTGMTRLLSGGTLSLNGASARALTNGTFENRGGGVWSGTVVINAGNGAVFRNTSSGSLVVSSTAGGYLDALVGATPSFVNQGALNVSPGGANTFTVTGSFTNTNPMTLTNGTLTLGGGGTQTAGVTVGVGAVLNLNGGTHTLNNGFTQTSTGSVQVQSGTITTSTTLDTARFVNLTLLGGALAQPGGMVVSSSLVWSGSTGIQGTGTTRLSAGTMSITGTLARTISNGVLENRGTATWNCTCTVTGSNGGIIRNALGATMNLTGTGDFGYGTGAVPSLDNLGTFNRTTSSSTVTWNAYFSSLSGSTFSQTTGTLQLAGGARFGGTPTITSPAVLQFAGGLDSLRGGTTVGGTGTLNLAAGTLVVDTATVGTVNVQRLTLDGGTLAHEGLLIVNTAMVWNGGTIQSNNVGTGGTTRVAAPASLTISSASTKTLNGAHTLDLLGPTTYDATAGNVFTGNAASIRNSNTFTWQNASSIMYSQGGTRPTFVQLAGTLQHTVAGTGTLEHQFQWTGGAITVTSGTLSLAGGSTGAFTGSPNVSAGATLQLGGQTFTLTGALTTVGTGTLDVSGGTLVFGGSAGNIRKVTVPGAFSTSNTGAISMTAAQDTLVVTGTTTFGGAASTITAGGMRLAGNFAQSGASTAFPAGSGNVVLLNGTGAQTINFANPTTSFFDVLNIQSGATRNVTIQSNVTVNDSLIMVGGAGNTDLIGSGTSQRLTVNGFVRLINSTAAPRLAPPVLELSLFPNVDSIFQANRGVNADTVVFLGGTSFPTGTPMRYKSVRIAVPGVMSFGPFSNAETWNGDLTISGGTFSVASTVGLTVTGNLRTSGIGKLRMQTANAVFTVNGDATFAGGGTVAELTTGTLRIGGDFSEGGGTTFAFQPSLAHITEFFGGVGANRQTINFTHPGNTAADSRFAVLRVAKTSAGSVPTAINLQSNVFAKVLADTSAGAIDTVFTSTAALLTVDSLNIRNTAFTTTRVAVIGTTGFNTVSTASFNTMDPTQTQLSFDRAGSSGAVSISSVVFNTLPTTGFYLRLNQTSIGGAAVVTGTALSPLNGTTACTKTSRTGSGSPSIVWNGTTCP